MSRQSILQCLDNIASELDAGAYHKEANAVMNIMKRVAFGPADAANSMIENTLQDVKHGKESPQQAGRELSPFKDKINFEDSIDNDQMGGDAKMPEPLDIGEEICGNEGCIGCGDNAGPVIKETHIFLNAK